MASEQMNTAYRIFEDCVAECRRIEALHQLPVWGTYWDPEWRKIVQMAELPEDYRVALANWETAQKEVNSIAEREAAQRKSNNA